MLNKLDSTGQLTLKDIIGHSVVIYSDDGERVCGNISPVYGEDYSESLSTCNSLLASYMYIFYQ